MTDKRSSQEAGKRGNNLHFIALDDWLRWQERLHFTAIELGLERCRQVADNMGLLSPAFHIISVGGTNGKGSSVELLRLILCHAGYRVGCYTSPHLIRYNERITIDGIQVGDAALCDSFSRIDNARAGISLTYFEFGTLAALDIFRREQIDIAVLEVGMGGRLDAVNVLDADVTLISSIDLDHQQWLGMDRESIGREKAGIFRFRSPAICADPDPPDSLIACARALGTPLYVNGVDFGFQIVEDTWYWHGVGHRMNNLPRPTRYCDYQIQNASGVLMVLSMIFERYRVGNEDIIHGLRSFHLPGRFQIIPGINRIVLDVAHNRRAAHMLASNLRRLLGHEGGKIHLVIGLLQDKDRHAVYQELSTFADTWHPVSMESDRACTAEELADEIQAFGCAEVFPHSDVSDALVQVRRIADPGDTIVVTGSFLAVGGCLRHLS